MPLQPTNNPVTINNLPAATALDGTELFPLVQGGVTKRALVSLLPAQATAGQFYMDIVADGTIPLMSDARYAFDISGLFGLKTASGAVTAEVQINGVAVTGLSALAVTSTAQDVSATALNEVVAGDRVTLVLSSNSSGLGLEFTIGASRG